MKTKILILAFAGLFLNACDGTSTTKTSGDGETGTTTETSAVTTTEEPQIVVLYVDGTTETTETPAESTTDGATNTNLDNADVDYAILNLCKDPNNNIYCLSFSKDSTGLGSDSRTFSLNRPVKFVVKYRKMAKEKMMKKAD